jgi:XTP/dITP diphosphohydrolase
MRKLVIATGNPGKLREFREMLAPIGYEIVPQRELGISDAEEPHPTFVENALAKARHATRIARVPAFADDSGICVAALGGEPGVHSARYAGDPQANESRERGAQDARNNAKLLRSLAGKADRRAHYYCIVVLVRHAEDPEPLIAEGRWHGEVVREPRGSNGFGYDPYFHVPAYGRTAAELAPDEKNAVSHRGQALKQLIARLIELPEWT